MQQDDGIPDISGGQAASIQRVLLAGHPNLNHIYDLNTRGLNGRLNPMHSKEISMTKLNHLVNLPIRDRTHTMVGIELPSTLYDFYDFMKGMIREIFTTQHTAQTANEAATKGLLEKAASGNCPQKCKIKLKVSLGKEEFETKAQTALDQELDAIAKKASDDAANILLKHRQAMQSEIENRDPIAEAKQLASEALKKLSGNDDHNTFDEKFEVIYDDRSRIVAMSSALFSLALYYGKILSENEIAQKNAERNAIAQAKAEAAAKKSAADAIMANADANMDKTTVENMLAKALKKQEEKLTAEFEKKLKLFQKNVGGDQSARTGRRGQAAQSPHRRDGVHRGGRGRSQTPRGTRQSRQSRGSSRDSSQERGRRGTLPSPSRSTRNRSPSTSAQQRHRYWFDPRPSRGSSSQRGHSAGASSRDETRPRSRSPGRGRGRGRGQGRGRGHQGRGGRDHSQGRDHSRGRDQSRGRGRGAPRRSSRSWSRSPRSSSEEYDQEREHHGRRRDRDDGQQSRGRGRGRGARGRPWTSRGHRH